MNQVQFNAKNQQYLVGGVSSSFRVNPFTGKPMYLSRADGAHIYDLEGNEYIDFFMGHGASPLGHNRPEIRQAIQEALELGFFAEFDNPLTGALAAKIHRAHTLRRKSALCELRQRGNPAGIAFGSWLYRT